MGRLDEIDMKILDVLHRDASISIPKLSTDLGLNLSVTYSRIKRLIKRGIIQRYTLDVNEAKLGFPASVVVGLNLDPKQRAQAISDVMKLPQTRELTEVTGRFDALLTLRGRTIEELHKTISDTIGRISGVTHTETFVEVAARVPEVDYALASASEARH
ncbi:MAG: Lrp/AsnC family transcriptional regulator [Thaumarchaeota archaeon]|nr:Lrp/AsnC family transcriptional regulator [Nitrososphaerota archaeon]